MHKLGGASLLETLAAILLSSLALLSIVKLDFRSKNIEKKLKKVFKENLKESPIIKGVCTAALSFNGITLNNCKSKKKEQYYIGGFSTLEAVLSIFLFSPLLILLSIIVSQSSKNLVVEKNEKDKTLKIIRINQLFEKISHDIDSHSFEIYPRIFKKGRLPLKFNPALKPNPTSDAIYYLSAKAKDSLEILTYTQSTNELYACSRFNSNLNYKTIRSFLVLDRNEFHEAAVINSSQSSNTQRNCINISLAFPKSLILDAPCCPDLKLSRHLIPLESIYAIYVDRKNTLRYLGFYNGKVIENQPILDKSPILKLRLNKLQNGLYSLNAILDFKQNSFEINNLNKIRRGYLLNFTLNYP